MKKEQCKIRTIQYSLNEVFIEGLKFMDDFHNSGLTNYQINTLHLRNDKKIAKRIVPIIETDNDAPSFVFGMHSPTTLGVAIITEYLDAHLDDLMFMSITGDQWHKLRHLSQVIDKNQITII